MRQSTYLSTILHFKHKKYQFSPFFPDFYFWKKLKMAAKMVTYQARWVEIQFAKKTNVIC